jgi:integrase
MRIHLRKRVGQISEAKLKKGKKRKISLYLAFQQAGKKTRYEWLKLYLFDNPKTILDKEHNKETMKLAESVRAKRMLDMQTTRHGFVSNEKGKISFLDYFENITTKRFDEGGDAHNWKSTLAHLKNYSYGNDYTLEQIDELFLEGFKEYLTKNALMSNGAKLNPNTAMSYFSKVKTALKEAFMNKMIKDNPSLRVKGIRCIDTHRQYLTLEELQKLVATDCESYLIKKAFLFSCLTGLRWSDVSAMTWNKIKYSETNGWSIEFTQQKTRKSEVLPISEQAVKLLGVRREDDSLIFEDLKYNSWMSTRLQNWIKDAGITKKITFHCARHSFATLQLSMNTDIYTVSKMLGHRHLKTTEIYAKVIDKKKIEAANRMPSLI